ncbi:MAG: 4-oxalocrotonate tautomerase [Veillonella sp.]|uniref:4-oxalocrotonate tautomerase n=1 Tax=Veillonella sp. TaxID=1926307 RepID=UPI0025F019CA|nr:4-oxalocrotonate tautomerase [Veillonella sp.]MBS4913862.1 4-oxalocrotonate tautomerase [Veillonella sp.]
MPIIHVELVEGRTKEQKKQLGEAITQATVDIVKVPKEAVKVIFVDMKKDDFMEGGVLRSEK